MEFPMPDIAQITPIDMKNMLERGEECILVDVREQDEWDYCHVDNSVLKPLSQAATWLEELESDVYYIFLCHHGNRSMQAAAVAQSYGVVKVGNIVGGIDAWSLQVDAEVPRY
jgi:rhodanese-related sulfurtransferase